MRKRLYKYSIALLAAILPVACSKAPSGILPEKKMQAVLVDMQLAEAMIQTNYADYTDVAYKDALYQSVFKKHKITQAVYDSSLVWYGKNLDIYIEVLNLALANVDEHIKSMGDIQASAAPASNQDSIDIWPRRDFLILQPGALFNGVTFDIKPDMNYSSGSTFVLGMHVWGLTDTMRFTPEVHMAIDQIDTTLFVNRKITIDGYYETILRGIPTKQVRSVYGYIRMDNAGAKYYKIYIDNLNLIKYNYGSEAIKHLTDSIP
ncbi:MAG: DUF4296 domain-containing protein [Tannerellaceae bacterium]|jgi:hypothetical protein|nr:DUF4296 domain-containing protein [Tannerellaceae bacterium]